jgi:hypothetical protein
MTKQQIALGRHALGLPNRGKLSYRNYFVAGEDHDDWVEWMAMVKDGNAVRFNGSQLTGDDFVFRLTNQGAIACLKGREKLSKVDFISEGHQSPVTNH